MIGIKRKFSLTKNATILTLLIANLVSAEEITITDKVILKDCKNFGVNVSNDSFNAPMLKQRLNMNFEGTLYQHMFIAAENQDNKDGVLVAKTNNKSSWFKDTKKSKALIKHPNAEFWAVSGPNRGEALKLVSVEFRKDAVLWGGKKSGLFLKFDKEITVPPWGGIAFRLKNLSEGQLLCAGGGSSNFKNCEISTDVPSNSKGFSSCLLNGKAHHTTTVADPKRMDVKGAWGFNFWAKGVDGDSTLIFKFGGQNLSIQVAKDWKQYKHELHITEDKTLGVRFQSQGDKILIDDVKGDKLGYKNKTSFNDDLLDVIKELGTGMPLRSGDVCEGTIENMIGSPDDFYKHAWRANQQTGPKNKHNSYYMPLHQLYDFCAKTNNEPWYILPGIMKVKEFEQFIEYLGAPADVGFGKIRAAQGQIKPWTEVLNEIHLEIGNETWNLMFWGANCNGADYWTDLINAAHKSPYWKDNISIILNERSHGDKKHAHVTKIHTNADAYSMAPYVIHDIKKVHTAELDNDSKLFQWVFGKGITWARVHKKAADEAHANNAEYKIYEINHHLMYGYSPVDFCQKFQASVGGGINIANSMLINLKENKARSQCFFKLFGGGTRKKTDKGVWGTVFNADKKKRRYHPLFLAMMVLNKSIGGELLETKSKKTSSFKIFKEKEVMTELNVVPEGTKGALKIPNNMHEEAGKYLTSALGRGAPKAEKQIASDWYVKQLRFTSDKIDKVHDGIVDGMLRGFAFRVGGKIKALKEENKTAENIKKEFKKFKTIKFRKASLVEQDMPAIWSYAFKDKNKQSIILINLDPEKENKVKLNFSNSAQNNIAKKYLLTSENITDANWLEDGESKVKIQESEIKDFKTGKEITLKPFSLQSIVWEID